MSGATTKCRPLRNVLLIVGSVLAALLVGEGVLAVLEHKQMRLDHRGFYTYDPLLGWKMKPNTRRINVTEEFRAIEETNSKGIRGGEYSYEKGPNEYRILILGDSFAEGYTVDFENLFSEVLKSTLNSGSHGTYYEVINAGTVGYGTDQELLFYQSEGYKYDPDLVIVMFYENDVIDNVTRRENYGKFKPLFRIRDNRPVLEERPVPEESRSRVPESSADHPGLSHWLKKRSRVYSILDEGLTMLGLTAPEASATPSTSLEFGPLSRERGPEIEQAWKLTELLLVDLKRRVEASCADLLVFYVPSIHSVDPDSWNATRKQYGMTGDQWNPSQVESDLLRICRRHSVPCVATIALFKERAKTRGESARCFYHLRDGHWNVEGHRFAGEILAHSVSSGAHKPRVTVGSSSSSSNVTDCTDRAQ
ncbi:MAG: SGNH/GDSL hydrolase family protein [Desulfomonilaceae bacterium]|nr:SGNH/GDSL hydrolase family protein [Desulfomonilaceae bacterium]